MPPNRRLRCHNLWRWVIGVLRKWAQVIFFSSQCAACGAREKNGAVKEADSVSPEQRDGRRQAGKHSLLLFGAVPGLKGNARIEAPAGFPCARQGCQTSNFPPECPVFKLFVQVWSVVLTGQCNVMQCSLEWICVAKTLWSWGVSWHSLQSTSLMFIASCDIQSGIHSFCFCIFHSYTGYFKAAIQIQYLALIVYNLCHHGWAEFSSYFNQLQYKWLTETNSRRLWRYRTYLMKSGHAYNKLWLMDLFQIILMNYIGHIGNNKMGILKTV